MGFYSEGSLSLIRQGYSTRMFTATPADFVLFKIIEILCDTSGQNQPFVDQMLFKIDHLMRLIEDP